MGAFIAGVYVDKTRKFEEVEKIFVACLAMAVALFAVVSYVKNFECILS